MEQLIALLIFAVCVTACVKIFTEAHLTSIQAYELNNALTAARNGAECYKATGGNMQEAAEILHGVYKTSEAAVYFDAAWETCQADDAAYVLNLRPQDGHDAPFPVYCGLSVEKTNGDKIVAFTVAAGRVSGE